jgi:hypothetical protein
MIDVHATVSMDGQGVAALVARLNAVGAGTGFREVTSGAKIDRGRLIRLTSGNLAGRVHSTPI